LRFSILAAVFPLVFLAELPDKTMFASLVLASRGRPLAVWVGSSVAFAVHVVIAVTVGSVVFHLVPRRALDGVVGAMFLFGAVYSWRSRRAADEEADAASAGSALASAVTSAGVIFVAEWGDLTQIVTANLAASYHDPLTVGVGSLAALVVVAGLAVASGSRLLRVVSVPVLRSVTAAALFGLAVYEFARLL